MRRPTTTLWLLFYPSSHSRLSATALIISFTFTLGHMCSGLWNNVPCLVSALGFEGKPRHVSYYDVMTPFGVHPQYMEYE